MPIEKIELYLDKKGIKSWQTGKEIRKEWAFGNIGVKLQLLVGDNHTYNVDGMESILKDHVVAQVKNQF